MPVVIDVQRLRVRSLDVDFHEISWEIAPTTEDIFDYTFQVLRSEGAEGPYEPVAPEFEDQYLFVDNSIRRGHAYRKMFYRLHVKHKASGDTKEWGPVTQEADADLIATEIRKHMNILFREFAGRRCWVLPVRTFGSRCGACWNPTLQKRRISGCLTCFDTGFTRGFMRPIEAWVQFDPNAKAEQNMATGPTQQHNTTARLGYYPPIKPRDIIIEGENKRWRVVQITTTEQLRAPLHQECSLHEIPKTDIEYRVELDLGVALKDLWLSPARNFTNPQNLGNFKDEEIPNIFSIYPSTYPPTKT
jgi:hypothetical protein